MLRSGKQKIKTLSLAPFGDGRFEVFVDGKKLWSKLDTGSFPDEEKLVREIVQGA